MPSTYQTIESWLADDFEADDFADKWLPYGAGFGGAGTGDGPLTSFGMTDSPGGAEANHIYGVEWAERNGDPGGDRQLPDQGDAAPRKGGSCFFGSPRRQHYSGAREFNAGETAGSAMAFLQTVPILGLDGHSLPMFFEYSADSTPIAEEGAWDKSGLECYAPLAAHLSYEFLDGTSMAAPHVTGAAALLFSMKPDATVSEVRDALLDSVDSVASLEGKTTTGG